MLILTKKKAQQQLSWFLLNHVRTIFVKAALKQNFSLQLKGLLQFSLDYYKKIDVTHGSSVISLETSGCLRANTEASGAPQ